MASRQHELPHSHAGTSAQGHLVPGLYDPACCGKLLVDVLPGPRLAGQVVLIAVCHDSADYRPVLTAAGLLTTWEAPTALPSPPSRAQGAAGPGCSSRRDHDITHLSNGHAVRRSRRHLRTRMRFLMWVARCARWLRLPEAADLRVATRWTAHLVRPRMPYRSGCPEIMLGPISPSTSSLPGGYPSLRPGVGSAAPSLPAC